LAEVIFGGLSHEKPSNLLFDCLPFDLHHPFKLKVIRGFLHFTFELFKVVDVRSLKKTKKNPFAIV